MKEKKERVSSMIEPSINSLLEKVDSRYYSGGGYRQESQTAYGRCQQTDQL